MSERKSESNVSRTLEKWYRAKEKLGKLEEEIKEYKRQIGREMNENNKESLESSEYKVTRRRNTRTYISKESVPKEIWDKYKVRCGFDCYYLVRK